MARSTAARSPAATSDPDEGDDEAVGSMPHTVGRSPPGRPENAPAGVVSDARSAGSWCHGPSSTQRSAGGRGWRVRRMRVSATTMSLSWIPSESVWGPLKLGFDLGLSHWDEPVPDRLSGVDEVQALHDAGRFRFANVLQAWVEVADGRIVDHQFGDRSGMLMGETTVRLARGGVTFAAVGLPVLRSAEVTGDGPGGGAVVFRQTVGGRTAIP